jgi:hypothetical protein
VARAFTSADVVQHNPGSDAASSASTSGLVSPSSEGTGGILIIGATNQVSPPDQWHYAAQTGIATYGGTLVAVLSRADLAPGEQSWPLSVAAGTPNGVWVAEEWTNLSYEPVETSAGSGLLSAPATAPTGSTGVFTAEYVVGIAALLVFGGGSIAFSGVTWSNSFVETDVVTIGTGTTAADTQLRVARRYGTQFDTGPWDTTATFTGGTQTGKTAYVCLAVLRAEDQVVVPNVATSVQVG